MRYATELPPAEDAERLPTLLRSLGRGKQLAPQRGAVEISTVSPDRYSPNFNSKLGSGAYGLVYSVLGMPDKVVKIFRRNDWQELVKESTFARTMKARYPENYVDCVGIGSARDPDERADHYFAVFERAPGITLSDAAHRFHHLQGIRTVAQALDVLDQLVAIIMDMLEPDESGRRQIHLDLKPENIMVSISADASRVALVDYGLVQVCSSSSQAEDAALQLFRWVGWEFLWVLASEAFCLNGREDQSPWEQLPEGFRPLFRRSDFRPRAYQTERLSPEILREALQEDFFTQVLSPPFRSEWSRPEAAKKKLGALLGELFYGVALASDRSDMKPNFAGCRRQIQGLQDLVLPPVAQ